MCVTQEKKSATLYIACFWVIGLHQQGVAHLPSGVTELCTCTCTLYKHAQLYINISCTCISYAQSAYHAGMLAQSYIVYCAKWGSRLCASISVDGVNPHCTLYLYFFNGYVHSMCICFMILCVCVCVSACVFVCVVCTQVL